MEASRTLSADLPILLKGPVEQRVARFEHEDLGAHSHAEAPGHPGIGVDLDLLEFDAGAGLEAAEESIEGDGLENLSLGAHPFIALLVDPQSAAELGERFGLFARGSVAGARGQLHDVDRKAAIPTLT